MNPRLRPVFFAAVILLLIWAVAWVGYEIAKNARITPDRVRAYVQSVDFSHLSAADRAAAIEKLAAMLNALSLEERQGLRRDHSAYDWFGQMTEAEKSKFLEATLPTGFKQMINAFESLPEDKRQHVVNQAVKQMQNQAANGQNPTAGGNNGTELSPQLQEQVTKIGLQSYYSQSSAQTKAELAPLLEEMQHAMENGRMLRGP